MKHLLLLLLGGIGLVACAQTHNELPEEAHSTESSGNLLIKIRDYTLVAEAMSKSLIDLANAGKLASPAGQLAMLAAGRIVNGTSQHFATDMLVNKIFVALTKTGKLVTTSPMVPGEDLIKDKNTPRRPDYLLSGKITEVREQTDAKRQTSFVFQLFLTSVAGVVVWAEEKTITLQNRRPMIGF